jgi:hypothetical protein
MPLQVVALDASIEMVGGVDERVEEKSIYELLLVCNQPPQISELEAAT